MASPPSWQFWRRGLNDNEVKAVVERAITAAGAEVDVGDFASVQKLTTSKQKWQKLAWLCYKDVGEVHFAGQFIGNALARVKLVAAETTTNDEGITEPTETKNEAVKKAIDDLQSPRGGQRSLMKALGINIFVAGECWLLGYEQEDDVLGSHVVWEALSINEIEIHAGERKAFRKSMPLEPPKALPDNALLIRVHQEDPEFSYLADSALRTVLDECEKLLMLTRADKAVARSRFAGSGLLFVPIELVPVNETPTAEDGEDPEEAQNPVFKHLTEAMMTPLKDEAHPSSVVPAVLFGPAEYGKEIKYITFEREADKLSQQRREAAIQRIATAIDLPPEILTGKSDINHWTAWQIHEETFQSHLQPFVELICSAITDGYLLPALKRAGVPNPEKYLVWYDDTELVTRPDKSELAQKLRDQGLLNGEATRRETGFDEDDKMDDKEYSQWVGVKLLQPDMAVTGKVPETALPKVTERAQLGPDGKVIADPTATAAALKTGVPKSVQPGAAGTAKQAQPTPSANGSGSNGKAPVTASGFTAGGRKQRPIGVQLAQLDIDLMTRLRSSMDEVLNDALRRAGSRIVSRAEKDVTVKDTIANVPVDLIAATLGPARLLSLNVTDDDLLKGSFTAFVAKAQTWLRSAQQKRNELIGRWLADNAPDGYDEADFDAEGAYGDRDKQALDFGTAALATGLMSLALKRLYDPTADRPTGAGEFDDISIPSDMVRRVVEAAGGSGTGVSPLISVTETVGGIGTGQTTRDMLSDNGISVESYEWVYGPAIRATFESHLELDGLEFEGFDDERLAVQPGDEWLGVDHYAPGDHRGCLCMAAPKLSDNLLTVLHEGGGDYDAYGQPN